MAKPKTLFTTIATGNLIPTVKQLFASAHEAGCWQGDYMLLAYGISNEDREWFQSRGIIVKEYDYIVPQQEWADFNDAKNVKRKFHGAVIEKYHLFREEFKQWDVVVYFDVDIIVTGPLFRLENIKRFAATIDVALYLKTQVFDEAGYRLLKEDNYDPDYYVFNSGVFAFNTKIISSDTYDELVELNRRYLAVCLNPDQLILNLYYYKNWQLISWAYDHILTLLGPSPFCRPSGALALHFAGRNRPWEQTSPYNSLWHENLRKAEVLNYKTAKKITNSLRLKAFMKETFHFTYWLHIRARFNNNFKNMPWFKYVEKAYRYIRNRNEANLA